MSASLNFVGIALPGEIEQRLLDLQKRLYEPGTMLEPIQPHITLLHPMSMLYVDTKKILPKMRKVAKMFLPLNVTLYGFDHLDNHTFHVSVNHLEHDLYKLQHELVSLMPREVQARYYSHPFQPHITICHSRTGELHHHSLYKTSKKYLDLSKPITVSINKLSLFKHIGPRKYVEKEV
jgi:2'-5' RNA ligase